MSLPMVPPTPPWWQRIRGARAISWQSVLTGNGLISIAIVASGGTLGGYSSGPDSAQRALLVVLVLGVASCLWALFGFRVLFANRRVKPVSLWAYALYYAANGTLYFLGVQWLDSTSTSPSGIGWPARLASSIAISLAWGVAFSLLLDSSDRFHARRSALLDELVDAEVERLRESQEVLRVREALSTQVDDALASTRQRLSSALESTTPASPLTAKTPTAAATEIVRTAASDVVRPLSHELQDMANASFPAPRLSGVLRQWWLAPRMPPLATALLVSAQTTAESVRNFGGVLGPLMGLLYFFALYAFLLLIDRMSRRLPRWQRGIYGIGVVGALSVNVWFAEGPSPDPFNVGDSVANVLLSLAYIVITSLFAALAQARTNLLDILVSEVDDEEMRTRALHKEMVTAIDELARELHGRVQTKLVVCAAEMERADRVGDHESLTRALSEAASALELATHTHQPTLNDIVRAWEPLLEVCVETDAAPRDSLVRPDVIAVVEEGLANAYRHGVANKASVTIEGAPDALRIVMIDDGNGPIDHSAGLGSELMQRLSHGRMTLDRLPIGTVLTVDLPVAPPGTEPTVS